MGKWSDALENNKGSGKWSSALKEEHDFSVKNMIMNIPPSAINEAQEMYSAVRHPQQTKNALTGLGAGLVEKIIPGEQQHEYYVDAVKKLYTDKYGGFENFKKTLEKDPIGTLADAATILTGLGGSVKTGAKIATKTSIIPEVATEVASKVGNIVSESGKFIEPMNMAKVAALTPAKLIPKSVPAWLYERAALIPNSFTHKQKIKAVKTALDESIPLTHKGLDKAWSKVFELNDEVMDVIKHKKYLQISTDKILSHIQDAKDYFHDYPGNKAILEKIDSLEIETAEQLGKSTNVVTAHRMKKKVYQVLRDAYKGEVKIPDKKGRMAIANGIRIELEKLFPEIKDLNARESAFLELNKAIEKSVERISHKKLISFRDLAVGGALGAASQSPEVGATMVVLWAALTNEVVQSKLAIALNKAQKAKLKDVKTTGAAARLAAIQAGRIKKEAEEK